MSTSVAEITRPASAVPDGWESRKLEEVCRLWNGRAYKKEELLERGKHLVLRVGNFFTNDRWYYSDLELDDEKYCDDGDLLYAWSASFGPRIWAGGKVIYHYHIWKITVDDRLIDKDFLFHFLDWDAEQIKISMGSGSTMIHVTKGAMEQRAISLPPLTEQRRIAEVLRSMDGAIAAADMVARRWAVAFGTLLDVAFLEGEPASLSDICSLIYRYPGFYGFDQLGAGVPVIRGEHLRAGRISRDWEDFYFVDPAFSARFPKTILELNDVVMSVRGTVGTTAIVDAAHVGSQISPNLIRLVADPAKIMPPLLYYAVQSAVAHIRRTIVNAQALPAINAGDLKAVEIALPPLADQPALLAELNGAATACADAVSATQQARQTKTMVMSDLLSGRVRVPA